MVAEQCVDFPPGHPADQRLVCTADRPVRHQPHSIPTTRIRVARRARERFFPRCPCCLRAYEPRVTQLAQTDEPPPLLLDEGPARAAGLYRDSSASKSNSINRNSRTFTDALVNGLRSTDAPTSTHPSIDISHASLHRTPPMPTPANRPDRMTRPTAPNRGRGVREDPRRPQRQPGRGQADKGKHWRAG